ncbi:winged helix-turn-helix transcriptional regulator [Trueperella pecoris]|uniref:Winged helix-turn-helix transcriptional regulator n=1 Tax=Trueperella pecoris TaxID=2733571 RepID=A0A7M1QZV5_9ACTO|nr:MarR family winged helix-turn-helix transcriptional regulator [Trueperella pecoris]QOR47361.1 winged helix-turn-helix transcriptional regulator [Trueperella pecoris]
MYKHDEVDDVVAAWHTQRPDFDVAPLEIFSRFLRVNRHFSKVRRSVYAKHGLETWEFEMLAALRRDPNHVLTAGQLMKDTFVSSGTITNRIDRMQESGLVTRKSAPDDGRVVQVGATKKGLDAVDSAMGELLQVEREILAQFDSEQNARAAEYLRQVLITLSERHEGAPPKKAAKKRATD